MSIRFDTQTPLDHSASGGCPSRNELGALIQGDLPDGETARVTDHVSGCTACQDRLDVLASGETPVLRDAVRHIDRHSPPEESALWGAIDRAVTEVTRTNAYPALASDDADDQELHFLAKTDLPGRIGTFDEFEVVRVVGRGGMGVVLHAFDPSLQRDVALKVLDPELSNNKTARQRFCREARAAAAVTHDNIVTVHQVNEDERSGLPYLVMQLVNGESLEQRLQRQKRLPVPEVIRLGAQAAAGLAAAHASGLIHRDVKPGNMLIEAGDRLKLTDFGLARAAEDMKLTKTGYVSGTPLYMAPEQARGEDVDARADLFSLGVVLYEALAGKPPFEGNTPLAVLRRVADDPHPRLSRLNPDVPAWLEDVVDGLLAKNQDDRIQSAAQLADVLGAHAGNPSLTACETAAAPCPIVPSKALSHVARRRYQRRLATLLAVPFVTGILLGAIGAWGFGLTDSTPTAAPPSAGSEMTVAVAGPVLDTPKKEYLSDAAGAVWSAAVCSDGRTLAVGLEDGRIRLFDMIDERVKMELTEHAGPVWCVDFHPHDPQKFVSASDDGTVKLWDIEKRKSIKSWPMASGVRAVAISPNGMHLAIGSRDGEVYVFNVQDEKPIAQFRHGGSVNSVAFNKTDGMTIASAGSDKTIKLWDIPRKILVQELPGHKGPVYSVAFSPCGQYLASAGWDKTVRVWSPKNGQLVKELTGHEYDVWSLAYDDRSSCEGYLASASSDGTVRIWDPHTGQERQRIQAHKPVAHVVRFATDGSMIISGGRDGAVKLWDVEK